MRIDTYTIGIDFDVSEISSSVKKINENVKNAAPKIKVDVDTEDAKGDLKNLEDRAKKAGQSIGDALKSFSVATTGLFTLASKSSADLEKLNAALLSSFKGNQKAVDEAKQSIRAFSKDSSSSISEVTSAFIKLRNLGLDPSQDALEAYSNIAAGNLGKTLDDVIEAAADASTGEFERLKEFGIKASSQGEDVTFTFRGVSKTVKKEANAIEGYLKQIGLTEYAGAAEKQAKTFSAKLKKALETANESLSGFGDIINEMILPFVDKIPELAGKFSNLSDETKKMIVIIAGSVAAIAPLAIVLSPVVSLVRALVFSFSILSVPVLATVAAISALAAIGYDLWDSFKNGEGVLQSLADKIGIDLQKELKEAVDSFNILADKIISIWGVVQPYLQPLIDFWVDTWVSAIKIALNPIDSIKSAIINIKDAWQGFKDIFTLPDISFPSPPQWVTDLLSDSGNSGSQISQPSSPRLSSNSISSSTSINIAEAIIETNANNTQELSTDIQESVGNTSGIPAFGGR